MSLSSQPLRNLGLTNSLAFSLLVKRRALPSHTSFSLGKRQLMAPSSIHSVNGPATLKFEHAGSPLLHARIQSAKCPGDRSSTTGGFLSSFSFPRGMRLTLSPRPPVPRKPLVPTKISLEPRTSCWVRPFGIGKFFASSPSYHETLTAGSFPALTCL